MDTKKIVTYVYYVLVILLVVIALGKIYGGDEESGSSFAVWLSVALSVVAGAGAVILSTLSILKHPKRALRFLASVGVLVILFFIGRSMSDDTVPLKFVDEGVSVDTFRNSGAGVWASMAMLTITVVLAVVSGVKGLFSK